MRRRLRGLRHMIQTKDKILIKCHPSNVTWDDYVEDCNLAVNTVDINSNEYSTEEEELARKERADEKKPENIYSTNSVIKICDEPWRSTRVCKNKTDIYILSDKKVLYHAEEIGISLDIGLSRIGHHINDFVN